MADSHLIRKKAVWQALSDLYLDTELSEAQLEGIYQTLKSSGFSLKEIEFINLNEVAPVLQSNLLSVAGEWTGFDQEWLTAAITRRLGRPIWYQRFTNMLFRSFRKSLTADYWNWIVAREEKLKS